jgi:hypothetical protein
VICEIIRVFCAFSLAVQGNHGLICLSVFHECKNVRAFHDFAGRTGHNRGVCQTGSGRLGLAVGTLSGVGVFLATVILVIKGGEVVGPNLALLGQFFFGYTVTITGAFIGLVYGFIVGFVVGWLIALLRNALVSGYLIALKTKANLTSSLDSID